MADFKNVKKRGKLGTPPKPTETVDNLDKPETAPLAEDKGNKKKSKVGRPKSEKTESFTTSFRPKFKKDLKILAVKLDKDMGDIIEEAVNAQFMNK